MRGLDWVTIALAVYRRVRISSSLLNLPMDRNRYGTLSRSLKRRKTWYWMNLTTAIGLEPSLCFKTTVTTKTNNFWHKINHKTGVKRTQDARNLKWSRTFTWDSSISSDHIQRWLTSLERGIPITATIFTFNRYLQLARSENVLESYSISTWQTIVETMSLKPTSCSDGLKILLL